LDELDVVFAKIESGKPLDDFINEVAEICKDNPKQGLLTVVTRLDKLIEKQGPGKDKINGKTKAEIIKAIEKKINELEQTIPGERGDALDFKRNLYFIHNISIFKIALRLIVMFCILLLFIILFLSIISVMAFFYYVIDYIITLFVNPSNITKLISLDYMHKSIIKYSLKDASQDKLFIILGQRFNLNLFNVTSYTIYLLIFFFLFYVCHVFYASYMSKNLVGALGDLDKNGILISIFGIIFIYSLFNLGVYLLLFKPFVITPYRIIEKREQEIDKKIAELILITANTEDKTNIDENNILVDDNFFEILYDLSRIDELNNFFLNSIKDNNAAGCLEQKLIIYDLYMYLREYITFDKNMQKLFKDYCTSKEGNSKPAYDKYTKPSDVNDNSPRVTFISLLNNNEVKMIKKYHEDLDFFNNIPDEYNEFYNKLNKSIDKSLKEINNEIITSNKTVIPFFLSIIYIFIFFFITFFIVYLIIIYALDNDKKARPDEKFFGFFIFISQGIKTYFYDKIFKWLGY
jgi:hypothetical protein